MKNFLLALPVVLLLATGCNSNQPVVENQPTNTQPTQNQQITPPPTNTQTQQTTQTPTPADTNLKTYTNTQYRFKFQYPYKNVSVADGYVSSVDPKGMVAAVDIFTIPHGQDRDAVLGIFNLPLDQAAQSVGFGSGAISSAEKVSYNGINWTVIYAPEGNAYGHSLTEKNGITFWIDSDTRISKSDFETIINSFKFTK